MNFLSQNFETKDEYQYREKILPAVPRWEGAGTVVTNGGNIG
jgi:hypothetical protein